MPLTPSSPVLSGTYPDPSVCRIGDDYYLVTSTFEYFPGIPIFHSTDLANWSQIGHAVHRQDQLDLSAVASSRGLYAPTIRFHDGIFYVVCTLVEGSGTSGNFVITATDPAGPWSDPTWLDAAGFDPSLYFEDERAWYIGTRLSATPLWHDQAEVFIREFDALTLTLDPEEHVVWHGAVEGAVWAEGPHIYRVDGQYYLVVSEGGTEEHHAISVARSSAVTGPYTGSKGNPIFSHRQLGIQHPILGVGHCDFVEDAAGNWWAFMLGSRPMDGFYANLGRETFVAPVDWELEWPVIGRGVGQLAVVEGERSLGVTSSNVEYGTPELAWTQLRTARVGFARVSDAGSTVTLSPSPILPTEVSTPSLLGVRQRHMSASFSARVSVESGVRGGIIARQSESHQLRLELLDGRITALRVVDGHEVVIGDVTLDDGRRSGETVDVTLGFSVSEQTYTLWISDGESRTDVASTDGKFLSPQTTASFVGVWFGVFAVGPIESHEAVFTDVDYRPAAAHL